MAGLINEGMEEGEALARLGLPFGWATGAGLGHGSLWPDLLMKGWRVNEALARLGLPFGWARGVGLGRGSLWPDLLMKGWRRASLGMFWG